MVKLGLSASSRGMRSRPFCVPSFNPCRLQGRYDGRLHKAGMGGAKRVPVAARAGREVARGMRKHEIAMTAGPELVDETSEVEMPDEQPHLVRLPGWAKWSALIEGIAGFGLCSVSKAYPRRKSHANSDWPPLRRTVRLAPLVLKLSAMEIDHHSQRGDADAHFARFIVRRSWLADHGGPRLGYTVDDLLGSLDNVRAALPGAPHHLRQLLLEGSRRRLSERHRHHDRSPAVGQVATRNWLRPISANAQSPPVLAQCEARDT